MKKIFVFSFVLFSCLSAFSQNLPQNASQNWVDSVFGTLTDNQKIAQLMIVRLSSIDTRTGNITWYDSKVEDLVKQFNIGGIIVFQGAPGKAGADP